MERSESIAELAKSLAAAQGEMQNAIKDSDNPFFKSKYADLATVINAARGPLSKNGLAIIQSPRVAAPHVTITTMLVHSSGEYVSDELTMSAPKLDSPQAIGSVITYARRYAYQAMVGIAGEDDDGSGAEGRGSKAASDEVRDKKLREIRDRREKEAPIQAAPEENPFSPEEAPPSDTEMLLAESIKQANLKKPKKPITKFDILDLFREMKKRYQTIGMESEYYRVLGFYGVEKSNEFTDDDEGRDKARKVYKHMQLNVADLETHAAKQKEADNFKVAMRPVV